MNTGTESQVYAERDFYGPLALTDACREYPRREMLLAHPIDSSKAIRIVYEGTYTSQEEMEDKVFASQQVLDGLSKHNVNHVHPSFINDTGVNNKPSLLIVVTLHENSIPYRSMLREDLSGDCDEQVFEADYVIGNMIEYLAQIIDEGGYVDPEIMHLGQFVYDDSQPNGQKMVLVDVEPLAGSKVDRDEESLSDDGMPTPLTRTVLRLVLDIINLHSKAGTRHITSPEKIAKIVESLPGESPAVDAMKAAILKALDDHAINYEDRFWDYN